jgi:hypothetical protein
MWTILSLTPAALLLVHQYRRANNLKAGTPAGTPVIVLIGEDLEVDL